MPPFCQGSDDPVQARVKPYRMREATLWKDSPLKITALLAASLLCLPSLASAQIDDRTACDFEDIQDFVAWFKGSESNQKSATAEPLDAAFDDYDEDGKKLEMVYEPHSHDELGWPILPHLGGDWKETYILHDADTEEYNTAGGMAYSHSYLFKLDACEVHARSALKITHRPSAGPMSDALASGQLLLSFD
ncbi:hypothetical protein [Pseudogemmobacter lacusdianii]|nr:hypothetical protein [Xinfangfangia sp. CPCC 101601]